MAPGPFTSAHRLRRSEEFRRVFEEGRKLHTRHLLVFVAGGSAGMTRLGITVTRRVGNAVFRNRAKRVTREAFRAVRDRLPPGTDVVVVVKRDAAWPTMEGYRRDLEHAFRLFSGHGDGR
ncbi:MAG: ribonuclease P protein component [Deltaproteobacteria bacterium]|nr:ribonuclease P protein component [Deltaproteobacteria bacterium]